MTTYPLPALTDVEWRRISLVIPRPKAGPPPRHDRETVSALCYSQAAGCSFERLPPGYPKPGSIRVRVQRWERAGVIVGADALNGRCPPYRGSRVASTREEIFSATSAFFASDRHGQGNSRCA